MVDAASERIRIQNAMWRVYDLDWDEAAMKNKPDWFMETRDPQPADSVNWLSDIISVAEPNINIGIPDDALQEGEQPGLMERMAGAVGGFMDRLRNIPEGPTEAKRLAENLESIARFVLAQNDARQQSAMLPRLLVNGFVHDQIALKCKDARLEALWKGEDEQFQGKSPFVFQSLDPRTVYVEWDDFGLCAALHRDIRPYRQLLAQYPKELAGASELVDENGYLAHAEWWTRDVTARWVERVVRRPDEDLPDQIAKGIVLVKPRKNTLGFIPIIVRTCRGTQEHIRPILYNGWKSKIFNRANLYLSATFTEAWKHSIRQYVLTGVDDPNEPVMDIDFTGPHVWPLKTNQKLGVLDSPSDPDLYRAMSVIRQIQDQTTVSKVIAGAEPGGVTAAAGVNLLIHGAKLALVRVQVATQNVYEAMVRMIFDYIRAYGAIDEDNGRLQLYTDGGMTEIDPAQLPKWLDVKVQLKADLPQDKITAVNMAVMARRERLISLKTAQEWMGIDDVTKEQERMDSEIAEQIEPKVNAAMPSMLQPPGPPAGVPSGMSGAPQPQAAAIGSTVAAGLPVQENPQIGTMLQEFAAGMGGRPPIG